MSENTVTITTAARNAYRSLSLKKFDAIKQAAILIEFAQENALTIVDAVKLIDKNDRGDGKIPTIVYHRINAANVLVTGGFDVIGATRSATLDKVTALINKVVQGKLGGSNRREDVEPMAVDAVRSAGDNPAAILKSLRDLEESLTKPADQSKNETSGKTGDTEDAPADDSAKSAAEDILELIRQARKIAAVATLTSTELEAVEANIFELTDSLGL